jgi:site-specific recombinase XerD
MFHWILARIHSASGLRFTVHALRHSFLTQLLRSGVPLRTASALTGHCQITTTAGYLRVFDEGKEDAVRGLLF